MKNRSSCLETRSRHGTRRRRWIPPLLELEHSCPSRRARLPGFGSKHLQGSGCVIVCNDDFVEDAFLGREIVNGACDVAWRADLARIHSYSPNAYSAPMVDIHLAVSPDEVNERATLAVTSHVARAFHLTPAMATTLSVACSTALS